MKNKLYVRNNHKQAQELINILGLGDDWIGMGVGNPLVGYLFDLIVFDVDIDSFPFSRDGFYPETPIIDYYHWRDIVKTKIRPGGKIINMRK